MKRTTIQRKTTHESLINIFLTRDKAQQDRTKLVALPASTYSILKKNKFLSGDKVYQIRTANDRLRNDITNYQKIG